MRFILILGVVVALWLTPSSFATAQNKKPADQKPGGDEDDYYKLHRYTLPEGEVLEAGGLETLPGGKIALGTRRGEVWIIDNGLTDNAKDAKFTRFAHGMHEILGL